MKADLHMHSTNSDGRYTMVELIDEAKRVGVDIIAITDHDTIGDMKTAIAYGNTQNVRVIPGIELSTLEQQKSVHILGYFTDDSYRNPKIISYCKDIKHKREERAKKIIQNLKDYYNLAIDYEDVLAHSSGIIARPHIAKAIQDAYPQYDHDDCFNQFIGDHCEAYIPSVELPVEQGIDLLKGLNCITVLAHPTLLKPHIKEQVLSYPFDGLEAIYKRNKSGEQGMFEALAKSRQMVVTAGSDFHGISGDTMHGHLGDITLEGEALQEFLELLEKKSL